MLDSPLFTCTNVESDSDENDLESADYDNDNSSIDSYDIESKEVQTPSSLETPSYLWIHDYSGDKPGISSVGEESEDGQGLPSTNPFAACYRKRADWDPVTRNKWAKDWWFVKDVVDKYESFEHAEFTRPFDQFRVRLQRRDLYSRYDELWRTAPDPAQRCCNIMNMLLEEAPDLIARYTALEELTKKRLAALERGERPAWETAWEKRIKNELGPWGTPRLRQSS